jgi:metal-dependent HD superfamily phosphatase/phosphodiesterase
MELVRPARRLDPPAAENPAPAPECLAGGGRNIWDDAERMDSPPDRAEQPSANEERVPAPEAAGPARKPPAEAVAEARVRAPTRGNRKLEAFLEAVNADDQVRAWWYMAQVQSERLGMSDHSWVHVQIVLNVSLRLLRLLAKAGVEPAMVSDHGMGQRDAEVVVAAGSLFHDVGMSIHRADHEAYSLFLAQGALQRLLDGVYPEPACSVVIAEALHAIIGHRRRGEPYTVEAGVVRVADGLDLAQGRSRLPIEAGQEGIHSISAAAIDEVRISAGEERPVRVEIEMNNSAGIFQVDDLLATKLRGTPLEGQIEVIAEVKRESEKRLLSGFRLPEGA